MSNTMIISKFKNYQQKEFMTDIKSTNIPVKYILLYFMKGGTPLRNYDNIYKAIENIELHISFEIAGCTNFQDFTYGSFDTCFINKDDTIIDSKAPKKIRDKSYKLKSKLCKEFPNVLIEIDTTIWDFM